MSLISWFFLICCPSWRHLKRAVLVGPVINAIFYCIVAFMAGRSPDAPPVDFFSLEGPVIVKIQCCIGIVTMFSTSDACFAGWLHYCATGQQES